MHWFGTFGNKILPGKATIQTKRANKGARQESSELHIPFCKSTCTSELTLLEFASTFIYRRVTRYASCRYICSTSLYYCLLLCALQCLYRQAPVSKTTYCVHVCEYANLICMVYCCIFSKVPILPVYCRCANGGRQPSDRTGIGTNWPTH